MRNRPNAVELISVAEKLLSDKVAPDLTERQRYHVALIISAMGIARRELEGGVSAFRGEIEELQRLYTGLLSVSEPSEAALDQLNRLFAADLRAGRFDRGADERDRKIALALLKNDVLCRLAEDNPRYVK